MIVKTLVVDDNVHLRRRVREFLASEPDIEVVGEAADGHEAILKARELRPDLVIMDVRMPGMNGVTATRQLKDEMPDLKIIMLTVFDLEEYREVALASGADGYVTKRSLTEELVPAIRSAFSSPRKEDKIAKKAPEGLPRPSEAEETLRECEDGLRQLSQATFKEMVLDEKTKIFRTLAKMNNLIRTQRDLGVALGTVSDLDEGLQLCFETVLHVSEMDCGGVYLVHEPSGALHLVFHQGLAPDFVRSVSHYEADSDNTRLVMAGQPVYTEHQALGVSWDEAQRGEDLRAIAVVPMCHNEQVIGCLNVASHTLAEVPALAREALETIAVQMCNTIVRLRAEEALRTRCQHLEELLEERTAQLRKAQEQLEVEIARRRRAQQA